MGFLGMSSRFSGLPVVETQRPHRQNGLLVFTGYGARFQPEHAMEIDQLTEEEIHNQYAELLGPINNCLRDLIASRGSATALADLPEFAEIVSQAG